MKQLREGFTTGSCAAACALASCLWQKEGECPSCVTIVVPEGREYKAEIHPLSPYRCAVIKDAGDDPDITGGSEVWAEVAVRNLPGEITFRAGEGVGVITLPGLKLPVGEAAINPVPREMIRNAVRSVWPDLAAEVTVGITGGREMALKTFNPRLGIEGGQHLFCHGTYLVIDDFAAAIQHDGLGQDAAAANNAGRSSLPGDGRPGRILSG